MGLTLTRMMQLEQLWLCQAFKEVGKLLPRQNHPCHPRLAHRSWLGYTEVHHGAVMTVLVLSFHWLRDTTEIAKLQVATMEKSASDTRSRECTQPLLFVVMKVKYLCTALLVAA